MATTTNVNFQQQWGINNYIELPIYKRLPTTVPTVKRPEKRPHIPVFKQYVVLETSTNMEVISLVTNIRNKLAIEYIKEHTDKNNYQLKEVEKTVNSNSKKNIHCLRCGDMFSYRILQHHFPRCKKLEKYFRCKQCGVPGFVTMTEHEEHVALCEVENSQPTCYMCGRKYPKFRLLKNHISRYHEDMDRYSCPVCEKTYSTKTSLDKHQACVHRIGRIKCSYCDRDFGCPELKRNHERAIHTGIMPYICQYCGRKLPSVQSLHVHLKKIALGKPCPMPLGKNAEKKKEKKKSFQWKEKLGQYMWQCHICSCTFRLKGNLKDHIHRHIANELTEKCTDCGKMFRNKLSLATHRQTGHRSTLTRPTKTLPESEIEQIETGQYQSPFQCHTCNRSFETQSTLNAHLTNHLKSSKKTFACPECPRMFLYERTLQQHLKTHFRTETHACEICLQAFTKKSALLLHKRSCKIETVDHAEYSEDNIVSIPTVEFIPPELQLMYQYEVPVVDENGVELYTVVCQ